MEFLEEVWVPKAWIKTLVGVGVERYVTTECTDSRKRF
jgi:hypothetical protein